MNSVITTYRDSYILGWRVTLQAEIFGPDSGNLNRKLQEIRNEISSRRSDELKALRAAQDAASWQQFKSGPWPLVLFFICLVLFVGWLLTPSGPEIVRISRRD